MDERETMKIESSVPVQGRVSIVTLAELEIYWRKGGVMINSMSQLLSWSVDAFREILAANNKLPKAIYKVADAHRHLEDLGLYQQGMKRRGIKKIATAMAFEELRLEGISPESYTPAQFKTMHRKGGVSSVSPERLAEMVKIYEGLGEKEKGEEEEQPMLSQEEANREFRLKQKGIKEGASDEELDEYDKEREKEVQEAENAELDEEFIASQVVEGK